MHAADALVIGESLIDIVTEPDGTTAQYAGGSAANTAVALARLGRSVRLSTAFADDDAGRLLAEHLASAGVRLAGEPRILERTCSARAVLGPDGSARYEFDVDWRLDPRLDEAAIGSPRVVHVCSLGAVMAPGADDVLRLLAALPPTTFVSYDVNARPSITGAGPALRARTEAVARHADLVKASDEDLRVLYPEDDLGQAVRHLLRLGVGAVVVTEGAAGARWLTSTTSVRVGAEPVRVVDTIGAGDTFSAALLDALWDDGARNPREVLTHAVRAATVTVGRAGADPPYRRELGR